MSTIIPKVSILSLASNYVVDRLKRATSGPPTYEEQDVQGKIAIVTGANGGIGKTTCEALAKKGATVIMACRNMKLGEEALQDIKKNTASEKIVLKELDLGKFDSIRKFASDVSAEYPKIDLLINNAGMYVLKDKVQRTEDGENEMHMMVNHLGPFLLTNLLLENLKKAAPSRVIFVASTNQLQAELDLDDMMLKKERSSLGYMNTLPYNNSKLANSLFAKELGKRLEGSGVTTYSLCPGLVNTHLFDNISTIKRAATKFNMLFVGLTPEQGCETIIYCALAKELEKETGKVYRFCKPFDVATNRLRDDVAQKLWELSEPLVGLKEDKSSK